MLKKVRLPLVACVLSSLILGSLTLAACGKGKGVAKNGADRPIAVTTTVVQPRAFSDALQALGTSQARESVTITAKVSDVVTRLAFDSGRRCAPGNCLPT